MKRFRSLAVASVVLTSLAVLSVAVPAGSQPPQQRNTIALFDPDRTNFERFVNVGSKRFGPGDTILFVDNQLDPDTCERAGKLIGRLLVVQVFGEEDARILGEFTLTLPDGKIVAGGAARFSEFAQTEIAVFAVTGGTDAYRDVSGDVRIQEDVEMCGRRGALTTIDLGPGA
jgi:hypothetical protein